MSCDIRSCISWRNKRKRRGDSWLEVQIKIPLKKYTVMGQINARCTSELFLVQKGLRPCYYELCTFAAEHLMHREALQTHAHEPYWENSRSWTFELRPFCLTKVKNNLQYSKFPQQFRRAKLFTWDQIKTLLCCTVVHWGKKSSWAYSVFEHVCLFPTVKDSECVCPCFV